MQIFLVKSMTARVTVCTSIFYNALKEVFLIISFKRTYLMEMLHVRSKISSLVCIIGTL